MDIECSDRADHVAMERQPRRSTQRPTNLQTLLRYALDATKPEEDEGQQPLGPMEEERRRFLEEALRSLTVDVPKVLQRGIRVLTNTTVMNNIQYGQQLPDVVRAAFSNMMEFVDDIDIANDFQKLGGFAVFPICFGSENEQVRIKAYQLLSEICQNNPNCQARVLNFGLLNVMLHLAVNERGPALTKLTSAISCSIREYEPGCREFISQGGCEVLLSVLPEAYAPATNAIIFLINNLCQNYPEAKEIVVRNKIVEILVKKLNSKHNSASEHILMLLKTLMDGMDPNILQQLREPSLDLRDILESLLKDRGLENQEKEYCLALLKIFENYPRFEVNKSEKGENNEANEIDR